MIVERDAGPRVKDAAEVAGHEIAGDDLVLRVSQDSLHRAFGGRLHCRFDLVVRCLPNSNLHCYDRSSQHGRKEKRLYQKSE